MPTNSSAREVILARIREAVPQTSTGAPQDTTTSPADTTLFVEYEAIERRYNRSSTPDRAALLHQLEDRLRDYDAGVYYCAESDISSVISSILAERGKSTMAFPAGLPASWMQGQTLWIQDDRTDIGPGNIGPFAACDGVLTTASVAIAETGSIVLQDLPGQGRRALTLLPDYHLCVLPVDRVVGSVPEAMALLKPTAALATTFFSGPSATADIEMTRIKGVHGPRFVDVILVS